MDQRTRDALESSIKHWQANADANDVSNASVKGDDCALCNTFNVGIGGGCKGCPVRQRTGRDLCAATPFRTAWLALDDWRDGRGTASDFRNAARAELDFLISLRPADPSPPPPRNLSTAGKKMSRIVGACLSQFHNDADNFELLLAHADGREIGHVVSREVVRSIVRELVEQAGVSGSSDPVVDFAEWLNAGPKYAASAGNVIDVRVTTKDGNKLRLTGGAVSTGS